MQPPSSETESIQNGTNERASTKTQPTNDEDQSVSRVNNIDAVFLRSLRWNPTSEQELEQIESEILAAALTRPFKSYLVDIGPGWGESSNNIRTIEMLTNEEISQQKIVGDKNCSVKTAKQPLVMVHGFAVGVATWILNLDSLSSTLDRKVYAFDLIGFGRSSRPTFDLSGDVESQFIDTFEKWRQQKNIDKFILLGHSFGGYLSGAYALKYATRVSHLILADAWGVPDQQLSRYDIYNGFPLWLKLIRAVLRQFSPLALLRAVGPLGPRLLRKTRADLAQKFEPKLKDEADKILDYIYHCNAQKASGEIAFKALTIPFAWAKNPLIHRLKKLEEPISMTFIYGAKSWIDRSTGESLRDCLGPERVFVKTIQNSGHFVNADDYVKFNELVREACAKVVG